MGARDWGLLRPASFQRHVRVALAIRRLTPEGGVVHCGRGLPEGLSARMAQAFGGAPYVCWTHGEELGFASTSRELTWLLRRVFSGARGLIANSENSRRLLIDRWNVRPGKVAVVYPGVDVDRFTPSIDGQEFRRRYAGDDDFVLVTVGRLQRRKGHDTVIAALPEIRRRGVPVHYIVVGDGPERASLEEQARSAGVGDVTHFVGAASEADLPRWYRAGDVFVMPNRTDGVDFEGFGIVFLEAAASGLPVIAGASGGAPEAVDSPRTGLVVDGRNVQSVASAIIELAESPERRRRCGHEGRVRVMDSFSWDEAARRLAALEQASHP